MGMDLNAIKSKLTALQTQRQGGGQKRDMSLILWKPTVGKHSVRIVPSVIDKSNPFKYNLWVALPKSGSFEFSKIFAINE